MKIHHLLRIMGPIPTIIVFAVSLPFLIIGITGIFQAKQAADQYTRSPGKVVGNDYLGITDLEDSTRTSWAYYPVVRFTSDSGQEFTFTDGVGTYPPEFEAGEIVEVLYDPEQPQQAKIDSWKRVWFAPFWISGIGLLPIIALLGWAVWRYQREEKQMAASRRQNQR
jgi:hypothetical protein